MCQALKYPWACSFIHNSVHTFVGNVRSVAPTCSVPSWMLPACFVRLFGYFEFSCVAFNSFPAFTCVKEGNFSSQEHKQTAAAVEIQLLHHT